MVKMRLRRIGTKGRPFYRVVVAPSSAGRNGRFVETIGTYDPIAKPKAININEERALHWLLNGAQPTETTAYLLNATGILEKYFVQRPNARKQFGYLDKTTAATGASNVGVTEAPAADAAREPEPAPEAEAAPAPGASAEAAPEEAAETAGTPE